MPIKVGDRVRLTGKYLRSTGQIAGPEGLSHLTMPPHADQSSNGTRTAISVLRHSGFRVALEDARLGMSMVLRGRCAVPEYWRAFADAVLERMPQ